MKDLLLKNMYHLKDIKLMKEETDQANCYDYNLSESIYTLTPNSDKENYINQQWAVTQNV